MALPQEVEHKVVERLFRDADELGWAALTLPERTVQYARWVQDPEIGGRLLGFMTSERARVWIKDGPMKEWVRAINGVGKYAPLVGERATRAAVLIRKALGEGWEPDEGTLRIKPLRIRARRGEDEVTFAWGPAQDLKHLVWAALIAGANGDPTDWMLCLVATFTKPTPMDVRQAQLRLAARCGLRLVHVMV